MTVKKQTVIVVAVIIIIAVLFVSLWIFGIVPNKISQMEKPSENFTPTFKDTNSSPLSLPHEMQSYVSNYEDQYHFTINKWEFDPVKRNQIILFAHDIRNESMIKDLQGKQIGNYTIQIIHDKEFEENRADVEQQLVELKKNPAYQISWIGMVTDTSVDPIGQHAELWVEGSTPENKKLDNTVIKGWKILVYPMAPLPSNTDNSSKYISPK
jgi:hypothetical protein